MIPTPMMNLSRPPGSFLGGDGLKIWTNPRATPNIVVLCHSSLYTSSLVKRDLPRAVQLLHSGAAPEQVFGNHVKVIPLIAIQRAEADLRTNTFWFSYLSGMGSSTAGFRLANGYEADELTAVLRRQLGSQYRVGKLGFNLFRICGWPLAALLGHAAIAAVLWLLVATRDGVRRRGSLLEAWLQDAVGPRGVMLFAAVVGAILLLWLVARFLQRPVGLSFHKRDN